MALGLVSGGAPLTDEELRRALDEAQAALGEVQSDLETSAADLDQAIEDRDLAQARASELGDTVSRLRDEIAALSGDGGPDEDALRRQLEEALAAQQAATAAQTALEAEIETLTADLAIAREALDGQLDAGPLVSARDEALARAADAEDEIAAHEAHIERLS